MVFVSVFASDFTTSKFHQDSNTKTGSVYACITDSDFFFLYRLFIYIYIFIYLISKGIWRAAVCLVHQIPKWAVLG